MNGITAYGAYIPRYRLAKAEIGAIHGFPGKGTRAVASHDEDTTTLAVQAARFALANSQAEPCPLWMATANPAYVDKSNAVTVRAALDMPENEAALDMAGALRSGMGALISASDGQGLAVVTDIQSGLPGSADERDGGDGAAAFVFGEGDDVIAELVGRASVSREFLDRWRMAGNVTVQRWEERFGAGQYVDLMRDALQRLLEESGLRQADYLLLSCPNSKAVKMFSKEVSARVEVSTGIEGVGFAGAADSGILLADALDRAQPGESIVLLGAADGCDALAFVATDALPSHRGPAPVSTQLAAVAEVPYVEYLTWRGMLERQPPRRPDPEAPSPTVVGRRTRWKYALVGSRCTACGQVHLPPNRVCANCGEIDAMQPQQMANRRAKVRTFTVDHLAFSLSPPVVVAVVDFEEGGRLVTEVADVAPGDMAVDLSVEMKFRRHYTSEGIHNYFWKASVARSG